MFVRIIYHSSNIANEETHECKTVNYFPALSDKTGDEVAVSSTENIQGVLILDSGTKNERFIDLLNQRMTILYMNDDGKTIDKKNHQEEVYRAMGNETGPRRVSSVG